MLRVQKHKCVKTDEQVVSATQFLCSTELIAALPEWSTLVQKRAKTFFLLPPLMHYNPSCKYAVRRGLLMLFKWKKGKTLGLRVSEVEMKI